MILFFFEHNTYLIKYELRVGPSEVRVSFCELRVARINVRVVSWNFQVKTLKLQVSNQQKPELNKPELTFCDIIDWFIYVIFVKMYLNLWVWVSSFLVNSEFCGIDIWGTLQWVVLSSLYTRQVVQAFEHSIRFSYKFWQCTLKFSQS